MKKFLSLVLAMLLTLGCASAFAEVSAPGAFPIVDEKVELTVFYVPIDSRLEDMSTNYATQWLEEKTNIHINWIVASRDEAAQKVSLMLSSGANLPDVFIAYGMSTDMVNAYGMQGMLLNLDEYIDQYGFYCKDIWNEVGENAQALSKAYDGHNYYLPRYAISTHGSADNKLWMNYKWLENLGLAVPETTEDFYNVLKAFKEQDANGNGDPSDEIPMVFTANSWAGYMPCYLMNSFVFWSENPSNSGYRYVEDDGSVHVSYNEEGYREGLKYLNKLYSEGLIDSECFVLTDAQALALASAETGNRIGCFPAGYANGIIPATAEDVYDYKTVAPLTGPTGLKQTPSSNLSPDARVFISADTKHPVEAFRWAESLMQNMPKLLDEGNYEWMNFFYGPEGEGWRKANDGELGLSGDQAKYAWLFNWSEPGNLHWWEEFNIYCPRTYKNYMAVSAAEGYDLEKVLYDETVANYDPYRAAKILPNLAMNEEDSTTLSELEATLLPFMEEHMAKFVTGTLDPNDDAAWASYLNELKVIGIDEYIAISQAGYDAMMAA